MSKKNGVKPQPKVTELILDSGITVKVKPLSPYTRQELFKRLRDNFPYPDEKEYQAQIEGSESPGATIPADDKSNPRYDEYKALVDEADTARNRGYFEALVTLAVIWPSSQDDLIKQYESTRRDLSGLLDLPDNLWLATLYHCLCASQGDIDEILAAAHEQLDIMEVEPSEDDIHSAWRVFQPRVSRAERGRFDKLAQRIQEIPNLRRKVQPDTGTSDGS